MPKQMGYKMNAKDIMDLVNRIERENPVDEWVVGGLRVWPIIRIHLFSQLRQVNRDNTVLKTNRSFRVFNRIQALIRSTAATWYAALADKRHNAMLSAKYDAIFLLSNSGRTASAGSFESRVCGPLATEAKAVGMESLFLEQAGSVVSYKLPRSECSMFIQNKLHMAQLKSLLRYPLRSRDNHTFGIIKNCLRQYGYAAPRCVGTLPIVLEVLDGLNELFLSILHQVKPRIVFVECYYSMVGMALIRACRAYGIPVVDLQHGVQGDYHIAYGRWLRVPFNGYELLPNYFWCWSEYEVDCIRKWNHTVDHVPILGGNVWLDNWMYGRTGLICQYDHLLDKSIVGSDQVNILVTLQPCYDPPDWFIKHIIKSKPKYYWWIRLHPGMSMERDRIATIFSKCRGKVSVNRATAFPLPALLRMVDLHVTMCSSVVLEAEQFSVDSIIMDKVGEWYYKKQIERGSAVVALSEKQFVKGRDFLLAKRSLIPKQAYVPKGDVGATILSLVPGGSLGSKK